jgi:hypothetical protein
MLFPFSGQTFTITYHISLTESISSWYKNRIEEEAVILLLYAIRTKNWSNDF